MTPTVVRVNHVPAVKRALNDPQRVLEALGLLGSGRQRQRQARGFLILCPVHQEKTPSCSVQAKDGEIVWKCHGCDASGDVLSLVAAARGLSMRGRSFRDVLVEAARIAGLWSVVADIEGLAQTRADTERRPAMASPTAPEVTVAPRAYPVGADALWADCVAITEDPVAMGYLLGRGMDPERVAGRDVARAVPPSGSLPSWAAYRGRSWRELGYRVLVPMHDAEGAMRSVRAWRVTEADTPKRLPPSACKAAELVMADQWAIAWLRRQREPKRIVIAEGEPDFVTWAIRLNEPDTATIGIVSGSWHKALAERFPIGVHVDVRVDHDAAGGRYFEEIYAGLKRRTPSIHRSKRPGESYAEAAR
jgi:hypothetical protein